MVAKYLHYISIISTELPNIYNMFQFLQTELPNIGNISISPNRVAKYSQCFIFIFSHQSYQIFATYFFNFPNRVAKYLQYISISLNRVSKYLLYLCFNFCQQSCQIRLHFNQFKKIAMKLFLKMATLYFHTRICKKKRKRNFIYQNKEFQYIYSRYNIR